MPHAHISGFGVAVPNALSTERFLEVDGQARRIHGQSAETIDFVAKLIRGTGIQSRNTYHPALLAPGTATRVQVDDIYTDTDFDPDMWQRMRAWKQIVPPLAIEAVDLALKAWGGRIEDITHIVTTGTSGWSEPGIACDIIDAFGLRDDCQKAELNFNGCMCGATCLRLARDTIRAGEAGHVLVVAAESPTTHYSPVETDVSTLIATCLFSDGAAAIVVGPDGPWRFDLAGMSLLPDSRGLLRMVPPMEPNQSTYQMFLDRKIGSRLGRYFREEAGATVMSRIEEGLGQLPAMAVHPGGPNILEHIALALQSRDYPQNTLEGSYETLRHHGNLGAAALPFVLARMLPELDGPALGTLAFGPGVTVEWARFLRT
jgi:predicted naringenin-chalcone synthase